MRNVLLTFIVLVLLSCSKTDTPQPQTPTTPIVTTKSSSKDITLFELTALSPKVVGTIDNTNLTVTLVAPFGTDLSQMKPTLTVSDKATVSPKSGDVVDLSKTVAYTVTAEDGTTKAYSVTAQTETRLLFYNADKGTSLVTDTKTLATISNSTLATNWSEIIGFGLTQTLFYDSKTGKATVADNKTFGKINDYTIETELYNPMYMGLNTVIFLGKSSNTQYFKDLTLQKLLNFPNIGGESVLSNPLGASKSTYLFYAPNTGIAVEIGIKIRDLVTDNISLGKNWTHLLDLGNGNLLAYNSASGAAALFQSEKPFTKRKDISLGVTGYTHLMNAGVGQVLLYNAKTGEGMMVENTNFTKLSVNLPASAAGKWTHVVSL